MTDDCVGDFFGFLDSFSLLLSMFSLFPAFLGRREQQERPLH